MNCVTLCLFSSENQFLVELILLRSNDNFCLFISLLFVNDYIMVQLVKRSINSSQKIFTKPFYFKRISFLLHF